MSFALHVDSGRWHANADAVRDSVRGVVRAGAEGAAAVGLGDLVPVAKGNGYGLGLTHLAREATRLGVGVMAVGTPWEVAAVAAAFDGDILVLTPYEPADLIAAPAWQAIAESPDAARIIRTVSSTRALAQVAAAGSGEQPARVVVEGLTSVGRFGLQPDEVRPVLATAEVHAALDLGVLVIEGLALHLPMTQPDPRHTTTPGARWHDATVWPAAPAGATARVQEVLAWAYGWQQLLGDVQAAGNDPAVIAAVTAAPTLWLSHVDDSELAVLRAALPGTPLKVRVGTRLWHGDRSALVARGTVLAVHEVMRGDRSGYRQRRAPKDGAVLVIGGGTAHGVALAAPSPVTSARQRALAAGSGVLQAGGKSLSPFTISGHQRWFAEPPHMQVSLVRLPTGVVPPAVGDEVDCDVRLTTATFDRILGLD